MIKVKEFLDKVFKHKNTTAVLKANGHYNVNGSWLYAIQQKKHIEYKEKPILLDNCILCSCNDETLSVRIILYGKKVGQYNNFYTYEHIIRSIPDEYGYFARSTDEEIIGYLQHYINILDKFK